MQVTPGNYSATGQRCMLKQMDGARIGRCLDADSGKTQPGGETRVFPCMERWYQFLSFGDGKRTPAGSMFTIIPSHIVRRMTELGHEQSQYMCLGVYGRGNFDEIEWGEESDEPVSIPTFHEENSQWTPLSKFVDKEVITTQCSNTGAVIEWLFVPFIVEEDSPSGDVKVDEL